MKIIYASSLFYPAGWNGKERPSAHSQPETAEGPLVIASGVAEGGGVEAGGHGRKARQTPGFRVLLRIWSEKVGFAGIAADLRGIGDSPYEIRSAI